MKELLIRAIPYGLLVLCMFLWMDGRNARSEGEYKAQMKELEGQLEVNELKRENLATEKADYQEQKKSLKAQVSGLRSKIKVQAQREKEILEGDDLLPLELAGFYEARRRPGTIFDGSLKFEFDVANQLHRDLQLWDQCEEELDLQKQLGGTLDSLNKTNEGELATTDEMVKTFLDDQATNDEITGAKDKRIKGLIWEENKWKTITFGVLAFSAYSMAK